MLGIRPTQVKGSVDQEVLIKWKDLTEFEATWDLFSVIQQQFPHFHLEDKVRQWAGNIDKPSIYHTYMRRGKRQEQGRQTPRSADLARESGQQKGNMHYARVLEIMQGC